MVKAEIERIWRLDSAWTKWIWFKRSTWIQICTGQIKARNPNYGWIPVVLSSEIEKVISNVPVKEALSGLIDLYKSDNEFLAVNMNADCNQSMNLAKAESKVTYAEIKKVTEY